MPKLTKQAIDSNGKKEKTYIIWDTEVKGFGCKIHPTGKKTYIFLYRVPKIHKKRYLTVGSHGAITLEVAREIVKRWSAEIARGNDPRESIEIKADEKNIRQITFKEFFEIFTEKHRKLNNKPSTFKTEDSYMKNWVMPFFGKRALNEISRKDVLSFKDIMKKSGPGYNRCFNIIRALFNKAEEWEYLPQGNNPCMRITKYPEKKMERFLSPDELQKLEFILNSEETLKRFSIYSINAIKLLIYTGCRKNEILSLKWGDIHLEDNYFHLKDSKTGERIVPLNNISKDILSRLIRYQNNPYVFPSMKTNKHLENIRPLWYMIRESINCQDVRIHDLRHSFASFAIKKGIDIFRVAKLLGHKDVKTTMRYAHISKEDMIDASNTVGEMFGNG